MSHLTERQELNSHHIRIKVSPAYDTVRLNVFLLNRKITMQCHVQPDIDEFSRVLGRNISIHDRYKVLHLIRLRILWFPCMLLQLFVTHHETCMALVIQLSRLTLKKLCVFDIAKANKDIGLMLVKRPTTS